MSQILANCEVVIVDGASTDGTELVVTEYTRRFDNLRYVRQPRNEGIDRDYDRAVQLARGEYCWLMTDDDLVKRGAIAKIIRVLQDDICLALLNYERRDLTMSEILLTRALDIHADLTYGPAEIGELFSQNGSLLLYIGSVVIKRSVWLQRNRERYYGTMLIHVGVIFQERLPGDALVIAEPLISYRDGNRQTFSQRMFEICLVKFPQAVSSFALPDLEKRRFLFGDPREPRILLHFRAMGWYSMREYRRWVMPSAHSFCQKILPALIALTPGVLINSFCLLFPVVSGRMRKTALVHLRISPFYFMNYWNMRGRND